MTSPVSTANEHLSAAEVVSFFLAEQSWPAEREFDHLLDGCPVCGERTADLWSRCSRSKREIVTESAPRSGEPDGFSEMYARLLPKIRAAHADLAAERTEAKRLLTRLLGHPPQRQWIFVANSPRLQNWGFCEELLEQAWSQRFSDPRHTEALARLAVAVSDRLPENRYGRELTHDMRARCRIGLANGQRIVGDLREAAAGFEEARMLLASGTGNFLEKAHWHDLRASLWTAMGDPRAADGDIGIAAGIYYHTGQRHSLGSALIKRALIAEEMGEVERSIVLGRAGVQLVDADLDFSVLLVGWLNLIRSLHSLGRHRDALAALGRARPLYTTGGDRTLFLRFQWLEGSIAGGLGRYEQAEGCLLEARDGFLQLGIVLDAAVVCLDLALVLSRQGRNAEVIALAAEMIAIFESRGTHVDALSALILLRRAAERERIDEMLLERLRGRLLGVKG